MFPFSSPVCARLSQILPKPLPSLVSIAVALLFCSLLPSCHSCSLLTWCRPCTQSPFPLYFPSVTYHLGYHKEELMGQSWYSLLHPEDADLAASQHRAVGECQAWEHVYFPAATSEMWPSRTTETEGT